MNWLDLINVIANILIGITAVVALWFSMKALRKSEWDSAMNTAPSLILRPNRIWVGTRRKDEGGYGVIEPGHLIRREANFAEIVFRVEFECFNAGRGVAFNILQPIVEGMSIINSEYNRIPLYQTLEDEPFRIDLQISKNFSEWINEVNKGIAARLIITYTNDQNNVFCRSSWTAMVKPFTIEDENLKVKETRLLRRRSKIEYSSKPF